MKSMHSTITGVTTEPRLLAAAFTRFSRLGGNAGCFAEQRFRKNFILPAGGSRFFPWSESQ
jgi:hypothetical protein